MKMLKKSDTVKKCFAVLKAVSDIETVMTRQNGHCFARPENKAIALENTGNGRSFPLLGGQGDFTLIPQMYYLLLS